jgi:hypothetical protein
MNSPSLKHFAVIALVAFVVIALTFRFAPLRKIAIGAATPSA